LEVTQTPAKGVSGEKEASLDSTYTATLEEDSELIFRSFDTFTSHTTIFETAFLIIVWARGRVDLY
jgi:hypothetical protein